MTSFANSRFRRALRRRALDVLSAGQRLREPTRGSLRRNRVHIANLHGVAEGEEPGFRRLVERLAEDHRFISYSEAADRITFGPIDAPYLAFSFDDGLRSCLRGASILEEFGAKAIFFVCPQLAESRSLSDVRTFSQRQDPTALELPMGWADLEHLVGAGHEIGGHGMTHVNLGGADALRLGEEIAGSFERLRSRFGDVRHFAWPYGRFSDFSPLGARLAFNSGYTTCASGVRGCHRVPTADGNRSSLCIRRDHIEPSWPLAHVLYFIARSSRRSTEKDNEWPADWRIEADAPE